MAFEFRPTIVEGQEAGDAMKVADAQRRQGGGGRICGGAGELAARGAIRRPVVTRSKKRCYKQRDLQSGGVAPASAQTRFVGDASSAALGP
jgi:hypothetical protein